jgi:large subunit ribosomal protein L10
MGAQSAFKEDAKDMPTAEKATAIEQTRERYQRAAGVLFTEYRGLKVHDMQALRQQLRAKGGEFHVVKNTLFRIAAGEEAEALPIEMTSGPTAIAFVYENEPDCAKVLTDFAGTHKGLVVKGGMIGGKTFDGQQIEQLAKLPPKDVLIAQVIGAIAAPLSNLVGVIEALYADPIRVIGAVADKVAEGSPAPAPAPKAEPEPEPAAETETAEAAAEEAAAEPAAETEPAVAEEAAPTEAAEPGADAPAEEA